MVRAALLALLARPIASTALAQEAIRMSLAGAQAAQGRQTSLSTPGYYNVQLGPTYWRFGAGFSLEYDDNINITQNGQEGDFLYVPTVSANLLWPMTEKQTLNIAISGGYSGYVSHPNENTAYIGPNSQVSFDVFVGDFVINLHDRFSISQNSYQDPTVVGTASYSQFQNAAGLLVTWDLNKVIANVGYDHEDMLELTGNQGQPGQSSDVFSSSIGYTLRPGTVTGLEWGGAVIHNSSTTTNVPYSEALEWNVGPYFQTLVTEHLTFQANVGYTVDSPSGGGSLPTAQSFGSYYANISLNHRLNRFVDYTLSGGRNLSTSLLGGAVDMYDAVISADWKIFQKTSLATGFNYDYGTQVGAGGEVFQQYGPTIGVGRQITKKLSSSLRYQFLDRTSNLAGRDYTLTVVTLTLAYQF